ncbi:DUF1329 domain-containing protein [Endozoicomonas sp.]|uniref:DUF1329 domain-containing protein n=1 Tax=Endozoicomonas sp. TaxID=1892382 RepID=UPI002886D0A2|nr:DUF1329 domain-containing protein [Endozoicomonas sp.]
MKIKKSLLAIGVTALSLIAGQTVAQVTPEEAKKLKNELTPIGAERAGNAEGTIPGWNPNFQVPAEYKGSGNYYPDPYKDDKALFTITAENMDQYKDKLSPGTRAMFKNYPETFKMTIYPSRRDGRYSNFVEQQVYENATRAQLIEGGNGVVNAFMGTPFPMPKTGIEALWNQMMRISAYSSEGNYSAMVVYRNGSRLHGRQNTVTYSPFLDPKLTLESFGANGDQNPRIYQVTKTLKPSRAKGTSFLVHEFVNPKLKPRSAWSYIPGLRRVRRAPTINYDSPQGLGNMQTTDAFLGFNGAPDKYNWKLVGKKEVYIPYNNYQFESPELTYDDVLLMGHANPDYMRYELHRVWVVRGDLKEGERHVYKTRDLFIDEDSWQTVLADHYDNRDVLWRTTSINTINQFDLPGIGGRTALYYDLISRDYMAASLLNEENGVPEYNQDKKQLSYFTPNSLRKLGLR